MPLVPPWVPDPGAAIDTAHGDAGDGQDAWPGTPAPQPVSPPIIAPVGRFGPARQSLGRFARTGAPDDMRRGLGHYTHKGLGGGAAAVRRFGGTMRTARSLYDALSAVATGRAPAPGSPLDPVILAGRSAQEVMDAVVEAVRPVDGTLDAEASREAIRKALSELLSRFPEADLLNLSDEERAFAIENYVALDVFKRFRLDLGRTLEAKAPSVLAALGRVREIREYIKQTVAAAFRKLRATGQALSAGRVGQVVRLALRQTFQVFEAYVQ